MTGDVLEIARALSAAGRPYALATVVWRRSPTSGQVGSRALVTDDGRVHGWLGGACAEPAVVAEARRALGDGAPRLMFLGLPEELAEHRREGVVVVPIACQSEGALEVFVEPVLPMPHVVAVGRSPAALALVRLAQSLGWRATLVDREGGVEDHPGVERVVRSLDLGEASVDERSFVVVATQGHYDEEALERALSTSARYVGLVASRKRAENVLAYLRDRGVAEVQLARVRAPAGLDLGRVAPEEIAVAVLAELVERKGSGELGPAEATAPSEVHEALDPVCGMTVMVATAQYRAIHEGRTYYFCSAGCRKRFEADPTPAAVRD